ncbi:MAG: fused MFS/spermidine synthase [Candidatus Altiarchaeota archaeon]|nr:fused MFS/spermidine synthase [Candidatus Altiarchaeota archaeon]
MEEVVVERDGGSTVMKSGTSGDVYSVSVDDSLYTKRVWDYFNIGPAIARQTEEMLILGLGGGTVVRQFLKIFQGKLDVVELNPNVVRLAAEHFGVREGGRLRIIVSDAMDYMEKVGKNYDVIVVDVFEGDAIPEKFTTLYFMQLVRKRLNEGGVMVFNTIVTGRLVLASDMVFTNAREVFPQVFTLDEEGNRIAVCLNFWADYDYAAKKVLSFKNPLFEDVKQRILSRIRRDEQPQGQ